MKSSVSIQKYVTELHSECVQNLEGFCTSPSVEELHQLRVAIKKLKAILETYAPKKKDKAYKPLRKIFKHAGRIREGQLNLKRLQQLNLGARHRHQAERQIEEDTALFIIHLFSYLGRIDKSAGKFKKALSKIRPPQIIKGFKSNLAHFKKQAKHLSAHNLHDVRKILKAIKYNAGLLPAAEKKKLKDKVLQPIEALQEGIGKWHDEIVLLQMLQNAGAPHKKAAPVKQKSEVLCIKLIQQAGQIAATL